MPGPRTRGWTHARRRGVLVAVIAVVGLLASGCAQVVRGSGQPSDAMRDNVANARLEIKGAEDDNEIDTLAKNALSDIQSYWKQNFKELFGRKWAPLKGGYYSVDPKKDSAIPCFDNPREAEGNAFYCPSVDAIVYDRGFFADLAEEFGDFIVPLVLAHEFGHAIQNRVRPDSERSIVIETQADCYAGVWVDQVSQGEADHFELQDGDVDGVLAGYLLFRDAPGSSADDMLAHGSGFDRISAFQEGFEEGAETCQDAFDDQRLFTETEFTDQSEVETQGNTSYVNTVTAAPLEYNAFWKLMLPQVFGKEWQDVQIAPFATSSTGSGQPALPEGKTCDGQQMKGAIYYCPTTLTIAYDDANIIPTVYERIGDYAVLTIFGMAYSEAILTQLGSDLEGAERFDSALCLTGAFAGGAFAMTTQGQPTPGGSQISPGDLDEAVSVLIALGSNSRAFDVEDTDAFQRIASFREGFQNAVESPTGITACDV